MKNKKYTMVIHAAEEGGFWAEFPELSGCFTQGETLEELRINAQDVVTGFLKVLREMGKEAPEGIVSVEAIEPKVA